MNVHCLRSQADGGILDNDDFVCDVAADKEQVEIVNLLCSTVYWFVSMFLNMRMISIACKSDLSS